VKEHYKNSSDTIRGMGDESPGRRQRGKKKKKIARRINLRKGRDCEERAHVYDQLEKEKRESRMPKKMAERDAWCAQTSEGKEYGKKRRN